VVYLWISENGVSGVLTGMFRWNKFAKLGYTNLSNRFSKTVTYGRPIRGFRFGQTLEKSADSDADADSESVTTLH